MGPPNDVTWDETSAPMGGPQGRIGLSDAVEVERLL